ncbi:MAG: hypothetical protein M3186_10110 [Actinomycetota bacterium]|nr:hypothetical protein [Actinomycetota bacterium]
MTHITPPPGPSSESAQPWPRRIRLIIIGAASFVVGVVVGDLRSDTGPQPAAQGQLGQFTSAPYTAEAPTTYSAPPTALPAPEDFAIGVKILEKQCFGSAGCSIGYQIDPRYTGVRSLPKYTSL